MKIIYAYEDRADDVGVQSGHPAAMLQQLRSRAQVLPVFPLNKAVRYLFAPKYAYFRARRLTYRPDREPLLLRDFARQIWRRTRGISADAVFFPGSHLTAEVDLGLPMIFCADATFSGVVDFYDSFSGCAPEYLALGHRQESAALRRCAAAIYASHWAARSAIVDYGADPSKVHVVPFGANVEAPGPDAIEAMVSRRTQDELRLLFIGREWLRKGADIVLEACTMLHRPERPVVLDIVGIASPPVPLPGFARNHGTLRKGNPVERATIERLLAQAHFLFVPSRAENYGMVFCEAAAFAVPSIASDVGGVGTVVRNGITGFALPAGSSASAYASTIETFFRDTQRYRELARSSRSEYERELNWEAFGQRLMAILGNVACRG
jgi:glycosyltransferase involved in cell wall biosynthesis